MGKDKRGVVLKDNGYDNQNNTKEILRRQASNWPIIPGISLTRTCKNVKLPVIAPVRMNPVETIKNRQQILPLYLNLMNSNLFNLNLPSNLVFCENFVLIPEKTHSEEAYLEDTKKDYNHTQKESQKGGSHHLKFPK